MSSVSELPKCNKTAAVVMLCFLVLSYMHLKANRKTDVYKIIDE